MKVKYADTISKLPPYLFAEIDRKKKELLDKGIDIISFGVGDPDLPTPDFIIAAMNKALQNPKNHQYPFGKGLAEYRLEIANFYKRRFNIDLNPETEIHSLIGSKEGIAHLSLAFVNPGEIVLCPEPGYPAYSAATLINHGEVYYMPLKEGNDFFPVFEDIPEDVLRKAKIMFLNSPNNPTAAVYKKEHFEKAIKLAEKYDIIIAHDAAYTEMYYDNKKPMSFLEVSGAKNVGIEFHSLSKTYNMTAWRIGFVVGNAEIVKGLGIVKDNFDSGAFSAIQEAATIALRDGDAEAERLRNVYQKRRDFFIEKMKEIGWEIKPPEATFYVWAKTPKNMSSKECAGKLLEECGIVVTPGNGFGTDGEGFVRFALTVNEQRMEEAIIRMKKIF